MRSFASGKVTGTGNAINVVCGFLPDYVKLVNVSDAGNLNPMMEWWKSLGDNSGIKYLTIVDSGTTGYASHQFVNVNGISLYMGSDNEGQGFTIGADGDINVNGEDIHWIAMREV